MFWFSFLGFFCRCWVFRVFLNYPVNADPVCSTVASSLQPLALFFPPLFPMLSGWVQSQQRLQTLWGRDLHRLQHNKAQTFAGDQNCAKVEAAVMAWGPKGHQQLPNPNSSDLLYRSGARCLSVVSARCQAGLSPPVLEKVWRCSVLHQ